MAIVAACEILRKLVALPLFNASSPNLARYYRMAFQYIIYIVIKINYSLTFFFAWFDTNESVRCVRV